MFRQRNSFLIILFSFLVVPSNIVSVPSSFSPQVLAPPHFSFEGKEFTAEESRAGRDVVFPQINGIGFPTLMKVLEDHGGFEIISSLTKETAFSVIVETFQARNERINSGNLRVALNQFALNGWLEEVFKLEESATRRQPFYRLTPQGEEALKILRAYSAAGYFDLVHQYIESVTEKDIVDRLFSQKEDPSFLSFFQELKEKMDQGWPVDQEVNSDQKELTDLYLTGPVVSSVMTAFLEKDLLTLKRPWLRLSEVTGNKELLAAALDLLVHLKWVEKSAELYQLVDKGAYPTKIRGSYLVPYSYLRIFWAQEDLIFGDPKKVFERKDPKIENHVNRARNILGSQLAHTTYFEELKPILRYLYHELPLDQQPSGMIDFGCGKGWVLEKALKYIIKNTHRGENLKTHPLYFAGVDVEPVSVDATKETLERVRQELKLSQDKLKTVALQGDFNDIPRVKTALTEHGFNFNRMVPYFGMVLHNRKYKPSAKYKNISFEEVPHSTGVFVDENGEDVNEREVAGNLIEVFQEWSSDFGLISLELYAVATQVAATKPRQTLNISYRHHHALSRQLLVEVEFERRAAHLGGYEVQLQKTFPSKEEWAQNAMTLYVKAEKLAHHTVLINGKRIRSKEVPVFPGNSSL